MDNSPPTWTDIGFLLARVEELEHLGNAMAYTSEGCDNCHETAKAWRAAVPQKEKP